MDNTRRQSIRRKYFVTQCLFTASILSKRREPEAGAARLAPSRTMYCTFDPNPSETYSVRGISTPPSFSPVRPACPGARQLCSFPDLPPSGQQIPRDSRREGLHTAHLDRPRTNPRDKRTQRGTSLSKTPMKDLVMSRMFPSDTEFAPPPRSNTRVRTLLGRYVSVTKMGMVGDPERARNIFGQSKNKT